MVPKDTREQQRATVDAIRELGVRVRLSSPATHPCCSSMQAEHAKSAKKKSLFLVISVDGVKLLDEQSKVHLGVYVYVCDSAILTASRSRVTLPIAAHSR